MTNEHARRKGIPVYSGFVRYFPDAILAVAELSRIGNDQHPAGIQAAGDPAQLPHRVPPKDDLPSRVNVPSSSHDVFFIKPRPLVAPTRRVGRVARSGRRATDGRDQRSRLYAAFTLLFTDTVFGI